MEYRAEAVKAICQILDELVEMLERMSKDILMSAETRTDAVQLLLENMAAESSSAKRCPPYYRSDYNQSLVECCYCQGSPRDPVMLKCMHNCCRACADSSATRMQTLKSTLFSRCPVCNDATELSAVVSNGLLCNYQRLFSLNSEEVNCNTCDTQDVEAVYWCADCCLGLCESCYSWHNRFHRRHRSAELEVARGWSLSELMPAVQCATHKRQMEVQCFTCRGPKCVRCYESCRAAKHDQESFSHGKYKNYVNAVSDAISTNIERLSRAVSSLQKKCQDVRRRLQGERMKDCSRMLLQHKRSLCDATVCAFDMSVGQVCTNLERIWCVSTTVIVFRVTLRETAASASRNLEMLLVERVDRMNVVRECHLLKKIVTACTKELRVPLRQRRKYWEENGTFSIHGSLPLTSNIVLRYCLGTTDHRRASPHTPLRFDQVSVTFRTTGDCNDLAVTRDGRVLLAAREHGLLVYSDRGQQLNSWRPERLSDGEDDQVSCVAALSDGRAAVGVGEAGIIVLLKLSETGDTWLQDRRVAVLQSPHGRLAVHGDLLAAAECRLEQQQQLRWLAGPELKLLRLSSGQVLYSHRRDYVIQSLALTALCVVTTSLYPVKLNSGATPFVLDAFSHSGEFLWRHETSDQEGWWGLCVSAVTCSRLYMAVVRRDLSSCRVMAVCAADGRDSREVMSSTTHELHLPAALQIPSCLSLGRGQQRTVLAVLSYDWAAEHFRTVSLYQATD